MITVASWLDIAIQLDLVDDIIIMMMTVGSMKEGFLKILLFEISVVSNALIIYDCISVSCHFILYAFMLHTLKTNAREAGCHSRFKVGEFPNFDLFFNDTF